jgi:hypothetical protein
MVSLPGTLNLSLKTTTGLEGYQPHFRPHPREQETRQCGRGIPLLSPLAPVRAERKRLIIDAMGVYVVEGAMEDDSGIF